MTINGVCATIHVFNQQTELKMTIAKELPPGLKTEDEILAAGYELFKQQHGIKTARYYFYYHEDYPTDVINEYLYLQESLNTL